MADQDERSSARVDGVEAKEDEGTFWLERCLASNPNMYCRNEYCANRVVTFIRKPLRVGFRLKIMIMKDFILFMYDDAVDQTAANDGEKWNLYLSNLRASGRFDGGSSIGPGTRFRAGHPETPSEPGLSGFIRVRAEDIGRAKDFLPGNPTFEAGGTVELRELPRDK